MLEQVPNNLGAESICSSTLGSEIFYQTITFRESQPLYNSNYGNASSRTTLFNTTLDFVRKIKT